MSNEEEHVVEEDWSSVMSETTTGFAQHETLNVRLSPSRTLTISCVSALSPLDMMNLSHGDHDATGHRIWMGAYFFIEAIARHEDLKGLFRAKRVLELGCGSGVSGLALLNGSIVAPTSVLFTDSDPAALELCWKNCQRNLPPHDKRYSITSLEWGDSLNLTFDTVLATDVLYDISSLQPMLSTVSGTLKPRGYLVLAHVPRASLPGEAMVCTAEKLEAYITKEAREHSLELRTNIRPRDLCSNIHNTALNGISFKEMEEAGAAILVFENKADDSE